MDQHNHPHYPVISFIMAGITWALQICSTEFGRFIHVLNILPSWFDMAKWDVQFFGPAAHIAAAVCGTVSAVLGIIAIYEKVNKARRK